MKSTKTILFSLLAVAMIAILYGCAKKSQLDVTAMDKSVNPGDNFFEYSVGTWIKNTEIPAEKSRYGSFDILIDKNNELIKELMVKAAANKDNTKDEDMRKVGTFYSLGMDSVKIQEAGIAPIKPELERIDAIKTKDDFVKEVAHMHMSTSNPLFYFYASQDARNSSMVVSGFWQAGLGLPDRDYYLEDDARSVEIRTKYLVHVTNMFKLMGYDEAEASKMADTVMKIETRLAEASNSRVENRDPIKRYNKMDKAGLEKLAKGFNWDLYFTTVGKAEPGDIIVGQPDFMKEVSKMTKDVSLDDWKVYLKWNVVDGMANYLSDDFVMEVFNFSGKVLKGLEEMKPRWKRVVSSTNSVLGEVVGKIYVAEAFPPAAKAKAKHIVDELLVSMGESIKNNSWMTDETKEKALKKLAAFNVKIGYPDKWEDYSKLVVEDDSYAANIVRANEFFWQKEMDKIGKPVDREEWGMTPQTVNAYYHPLLNEIVFPAAILQPPYFNLEADDALNYGAMGAIIGHEITHGFDDQGRRYGADGNLTDWWTEEDSKRFDERTAMLAEQFDNFCPFDSMCVNGNLTLGENIADLGGVTVSFNAFKNTEQFKKGEKIDGYTPAQRFFLGYGQAWRSKLRDEELKLRLKTDVHSPAVYRVLGPLSNFTPFYEAYGVKKGDAMYKEEADRIVIW